VESEPPFGDERERERRRLERVLPELLKRVVDLGLGKLSEGRDDVRAFVNDMKLPKEVSSVIAAQLEATKDALAGSVANEVRRFLERTSLKDMLSGLAIEVTTQVRFVPTETEPHHDDDAPPPEKDAPHGDSTVPRSKRQGE
jgi:hypothetical protein